MAKKPYRRPMMDIAAWRSFMRVIHEKEISQTKLCRYTHHHINTISAINNQGAAVRLDTLEDFCDAVGYKIVLLPTAGVTDCDHLLDKRGGKKK